MFEPRQTDVAPSSKPPKVTLFLADSNPEDLNTLTTELSALGYHVIKMLDGQQLLAMLDSFKPDIILIDSSLPYTLQNKYTASDQGSSSTEKSLSKYVSPSTTDANLDFDGFMLCRILAQEVETMHLPVLILGSDDTPEARVRSLKATAWHYIVKPPARTELHLKLQNILQRTRGEHLNVERLRQLEEAAAHHAAELQMESAKRRYAEEKINKLLETIQLQTRQLHLLTQSTLSSTTALDGQMLADYQRYQDKIEILQTYLDQLIALNINLQGDDIQKSLSQSVVEEFSQNPDKKTESVSRGTKGGNEICYHDDYHFRPGKVAKTTNNHRQPARLQQLTAREYDILLKLVEGNRYDDIAEMFQISPSTVRSYRSRIMQKLGISNSTEMIKFAVRHGLIKIR